MANQSPTVYRRQLGLKLRTFREAANVKVEEVARYLDCADATIRRMEAGKVGITLGNARHMADLYGVTGNERTELLALATQSRERSFWHNWWNAVPQSFYSYLGLESCATSIKVFENIYINGLLQTEDYTRALITGINPTTSESDQEKLIALRQARMKTLTQSNAPRFIAILDELVVARIVGSTTVMASQIHHLLKMSDLPNVSICVVPRSGGAYPGMEGAFFILQFSGKEDLDVVFTEGVAGAFFLERPKIVNTYKNRFDAIAQHALSTDASRNLLSKTLKELTCND